MKNEIYGKRNNVFVRLLILEFLNTKSMAHFVALDHHDAHNLKPGQIISDNLHQDAQYDSRKYQFDIQVSFFPQDVTEEMGGTLIVPGSHFRRVHGGQLSGIRTLSGKFKPLARPGA